MPLRAPRRAASRRGRYTPTITSKAFTTANAGMPGCSPSSFAASSVIDAVIVTVGETLDRHMRGRRAGRYGLHRAGDLVAG